MELALTVAAGEDEVFGHAVVQRVAQRREAEQPAGRPMIANAGSAVFTGHTHARAEGGEIAFGQVAGDVHVSQGPVDVSGPGRPSH